MSLRTCGRRGRLATFGAVCLCAALSLAHASIGAVTHIVPPRVDVPSSATSRGWVRVRAGLREVYLEGSAEAIGAERETNPYLR